MEIEELEKINERLREISQIAGDNAPSFIDCDKIVFMSEDNVIMAYQIITENNEMRKEVFNAAQCVFPGSSGQISLDSIQLIGNYLIGENIMLMEIRPKRY
jgi:hypothetical protein